MNRGVHCRIVFYVPDLFLIVLANLTIAPESHPFVKESQHDHNGRHCFIRQLVSVPDRRRVGILLPAMTLIPVIATCQGSTGAGSPGGLPQTPFKPQLN